MSETVVRDTQHAGRPVSGSSAGRGDDRGARRADRGDPSRRRVDRRSSGARLRRPRRHARHRRHARARQRARPHGVGRLRDRDACRGRRRHHDAGRHAAQLDSADDECARRSRIKMQAAAGHCRVDDAFWGGLVPGNAAAQAALVAAGALGSKCFPRSSPASTSSRCVGEADLRAGMQALAAAGAPLLVHAELDVGCAVPAGGDARRYPNYVASRPPQWEVAAIRLVVRLARETGCAHPHRASCRRRMRCRSCAEARAEGLPVTVETCPHYLTLAAEDVPDGATHFKCAPPIRGRDNQERALGCALPWRDRRRRLRSLALHAGFEAARGQATSPPPGVASRDCSCRCRSCGPRRAGAAAASATSRAGCAPRRRASPVSRRARARSPWDATPTSSSGTRRRASPSSRACCTIVTRSRRTRDARCTASCGSRSCGASACTMAAISRAPRSADRCAAKPQETPCNLIVPFTTLLDLASERLGGSVLTRPMTSSRRRRISSSRGPAVFVPGKYTDRGKWMDGWESRRKRQPGHDWCVIRLGAPGAIHGVNLDTAHFLGNFPPFAWIEAASCTDEAAQSEAVHWTETPAAREPARRRREPLPDRESRPVDALAPAHRTGWRRGALPRPRRRAAGLECATRQGHRSGRGRERRHRRHLQRHVLRPEGKPHHARPGREHVRRLGNPPPAHARQRLDRPAPGTRGTHSPHRNRHRLVQGQFPGKRFDRRRCGSGTRARSMQPADCATISPGKSSCRARSCKPITCTHSRARSTASSITFA